MLHTAVTVKQYIYRSPEAFEEVTTFITDHTASTDRFLYIDQVMHGKRSFHRMARRERFVVKKFVPAERDRLYPLLPGLSELATVYQDLEDLLQWVDKSPLYRDKEPLSLSLAPFIASNALDIKI